MIDSKFYTLPVVGTIIVWVWIFALIIFFGPPAA